MNWHEQQFCRAAALHLGTRTDMGAIRALWARGRLFAKLPELSEDITATALVSPPPGGATKLEHGGGLCLTVDGEILNDFPVEDYTSAIRRARGVLTVRINSTGGDLKNALAVHDALLAAGADRVECLVVGAAGSAASVILAAADRRRVVAGSRLWVHRPTTIAWGDADQLRKVANELETMMPRMIEAYSRICNRSLVCQWLSGGDHFFDANEALRVGLATEVEAMTPP